MSVKEKLLSSDCTNGFTFVDLVNVARDKTVSKLEAVVGEVFAGVVQEIPHGGYSCGQVGGDGGGVRALIPH